MGYQPIENYGVIGDMHSVALVGMNGSIDWYCFPHFDSPSIFGRILDDKKGGHFQIAPTDGAHQKQLYWPATNILITRFLNPDGVAEVTDYMPVGEARERDDFHRLIRRVTAVRGTVKFQLDCQPAFNFGLDSHRTDLVAGGVCFHSGTLHFGLATKIPLSLHENGIMAQFTLNEGETTVFVLRQIPEGLDCGLVINEREEAELFRKTVLYWRGWLSRCTYTGRWREWVERSALAMKLLTFEPTGAFVAAPTCSLPEFIGGERNWDYRYTWIRDAAFTIYGFARIGLAEDAGRFMDWLISRIHDANPDGSLQTVYRIDGQKELTDKVLDHLDGYRQSRPVRVGNDAHKQLQLDIYGELMDAVYLYNKYASPISYELWVGLRRLINWVCDNWQQKDDGVWEVRSGRQNFVYSKVMCWVALDRALRLADKRSFPADRDRWLKTRDAIYEEILARGWNDEKHAFVQHYDSNALDAATLIMPLVFFMAPTDPRMLSTIDAINRPPSKGGLVSSGLVYRYDTRYGPDGLTGEEGTFNICSFWLVEALTRAGQRDRRRLEEARLLFEKMLTYANHLGLYSEETGPSGEALGNFPQAFTHLSLISAAFNLDRALSGKTTNR
jgi:GH15 family glucan-1,4-alpha-glucosidase